MDRTYESQSGGRTMRKIIITLMLLAFASMAFAADSVVTVKRNSSSDGMEVVVFTWLANTVTGTVPATSTGTTWPKSRSGCIAKVNTNPGSTAPTDNYDITLTDADGVDLMGGELADRDTANSEAAVPKIDTTFGCNVVTDSFTLNISGQSVSAATGTVTIYIIN